MVMICWLIIHTSIDKMDNREYKQFKGVVLEEGLETNRINFADDFTKKRVDKRINDPIRWVSDGECLYVD